MSESLQKLTEFHIKTYLQFLLLMMTSSHFIIKQQRQQQTNKKKRLTSQFPQDIDNN